MTTTPPETAPGTPPRPDGQEPDDGSRASRDEIRDLGRLRRSTSDRKVAGVAGGLARHLDVDPLVLRVAFVVLAFFGGAGLMLYGACWLLVPEQDSERAVVTLDERSRTLSLLVVGVLAVLAVVGDAWGVFWFPWPLAVVAVVALVVLSRRDKDSRPAPEATPGTTPAAPTTTAPAFRRVPQDPRRRGPVLFWFTLALVVFGCGVLGLVDVAGVAVADSAYVALPVALVGLMLLIGSVWGRAGGLVLLGLVGAVALAGATAAESWDDTTIRETPTSVSEVRSSYELGAGELVLDLTGLTDPEALDGRSLRIEAGAGEVEVLVPDGVDLQVDARVGGPGSVRFFGEESGGIDTRIVRSRDDGDIGLTIDVELGFGQIIVDER